MAEQKAISANLKKNNTGAVLHAGNVTRSDMQNITAAENTSDHKPAKPIASATTNIGTTKAISGNSFAYDLPSNEWIAKVLGDKVGGAADTTLRSGASDVGPVRTDKPTSYNRLDITSWDYVTGAATNGAGEGDEVVPSGVDNVTGNAADNVYSTNAGEFTYHVGTLGAPTQADFPTRNG